MSKYQSGLNVMLLRHSRVYYFVIELDDRTLCSVCSDTIAVIKRMNQCNQIKPHYSQKTGQKKFRKITMEYLITAGTL